MFPLSTILSNISIILYKTFSIVITFFNYLDYTPYIVYCQIIYSIYSMLSRFCEDLMRLKIRITHISNLMLYDCLAHELPFIVLSQFAHPTFLRKMEECFSPYLENHPLWYPAGDCF